MPAPITGFGGHISKGTIVTGAGQVAINCVRKWEINETANQPAAQCSASKGATMRVAGTKNWAGTFEGYGYVPPVLPGDMFNFAGVMGDTVVGVSGPGASGDAIVDSIVVDVNVETSAPISYVVAFSGAGALTIGAVILVPPDTAPIPTLYTGTGCKLQSGTTAGVFTDIDLVRTMKLTLSRNNAKAFTSTGNGWPTAAKGSLDCIVEATVLADATTGWTALPQINQVGQVKMFVTSAANDTTPKFWLVKFVIWDGLGNMAVQIENPDFVGASLKGNLTIVTNVGAIPGTPTFGNIKDPNNVDIIV